MAALETGAKKLLAAVLGLPSAAAVVECMQVESGDEGPAQGGEGWGFSEDRS